MFLRLSLLFPGEEGGYVLHAHVKSDLHYPYMDRPPTVDSLIACKLKEKQTLLKSAVNKLAEEMEGCGRS